MLLDGIGKKNRTMISDKSQLIYSETAILIQYDKLKKNTFIILLGVVIALTYKFIQSKRQVKVINDGT